MDENKGTGVTPASYQHIDFLRRFRVVAYALVFVSITGFCYAEDNFALFLLGAIGCVTSWWLVESPKAVPLPRWLINFGVLMASFMLFWELVIKESEPNLLLGLGHFMIAILICKLFEQKQNRDYAQILTLTLLIMVAGAYFSQSLTFGVLLAIYLALGLYAILVFHLRFDTERALAAGSVPAEVVMSTEGQRRLRRDMRRMAFRVGVALAACATAIFVVFPRSKGHNIWAGWNFDRGFKETGFSDRVRFDTSGRVQLSDAIVMDVRIDRDGANIGSEFYEPYFRGLVLDRYDPLQRQWLPPYLGFSIASEQAQDCIFAQPGDYLPHSVVHQHYSQQANTSLSNRRQVLFWVSGGGLNLLPVRFSSDQINRVTYMEPEMTLLAPGASPPMEYDVYSGVMNRPPAVQPFLDVPGDLGMEGSRVSAQIERMAVEIGDNGGALVARAKRHELSADEVRSLVSRYVQYLRTSYPYSLEYHQKDLDLDPTTDFLVNRKSTGGHCEFFASALVMLCRAASLNARMVTGYHGGDYNSIGGFYTVRQKHSHAWVEVMIPGRGWMTCDASPAAAERAGGWNPAWLKSVREFMQVVQQNWLSRIVAFDANTRRYMLGSVGEWARGVVASVKSTVLDTWDGTRLMLFSSTSTWEARGIALLGLAWCALSTLWLGRRLHRRRTSHVAHIIRQLDAKTQRQMEQQLEFFDDLMRLLGRSGVVKRPEMTPKEYVEATGGRLGAAREDAQWLVDMFYAIRFGFVRSTPDTEKRVEASLARVRSAVAGTSA